MTAISDEEYRKAISLLLSRHARALWECGLIYSQRERAMLKEKRP